MQNALSRLSNLSFSFLPTDTPDQQRSKCIDFFRLQIRIMRPILRHLDPAYSEQIRAISRDIEACISAAKTGRPTDEAAGKRVFAAIESLSGQAMDQVEQALIKSETE